MKREKHYTGYAVVSKDILDDKVYKSGHFGISLYDRDFETYKRYCHDGSIVVMTYQAVFCRFIKIKWVRKYPEFSHSRRLGYPKYLQLWHLRIEWGTDYRDAFERKAVYDPLAN